MAKSIETRSPVGKVSAGHPVDVATGTLFHDFEDFTLRGRLPLVFGRHYSTALIDRPGGMFGQGWFSSFEMRLHHDLDGWTLIGEDGETEIAFEGELGQNGEPLVNPGQFHDLRREGRLLVATRWNPETEEIVRYLFDGSAESDVLALAAVQNAEGRTIEIDRDSSNRITSLRQRREGRGFRLAYNTEGRVTAVSLFTETSERLILTYHYDYSGRLSGMRDAAGNTCGYEYDEAGRMVREVTLGGMEYRFRYDSEGRCVETTGPDGFDRQLLDFNTVSRLTRVTDPLGSVTEYQCNANGQVESEKSPLGHIRQTLYDEYGRIVQSIEANGATTAFEFDDRGDRVQVTRPTGAVTRYEYNHRHQAIGITDPAGFNWQWSFDQSGRPVDWRDPLGAKWLYRHNAQGDLAGIRDPFGFERKFEWDRFGNLIGVTDWLDHRTTYEYDAEGRVTAIVDPVGARTEAESDALGRLSRIRHPDGASRRFQWNVFDQITEYVDELGAVTRWHYTPCGLVRKIIRPQAGVIRFKYTNLPGQLITVINQNGINHHYEYDAGGRMVKETDFGGRVTSYEYGKDSQPSAVVNAAGHRTAFQRNAAGQVVAAECDDGSAVQYKYDERGYLIAADNGICPVSREYDAAGRLVVEKQGDHTITSTYDALGNRLKRLSSLGGETRFEWDANSLIKKIQTGKHDPILFEYDARQCEIARYVPGGVRINQAFDERGRQVEQWTGSTRRPGTISVGGRSSRGIHRQYRYDAASNLTEMIDSRWGPTSYGYDAAGRVTSANANTFNERYIYDPADNFKRIDRLVASVSEDSRPEWQYGKGNELLERDGVTYEYDADGQLVSKRDGKVETRYEWNRFGQLVKAVLPDGAEWSYEYDAFFRRVTKSGPGQRVSFVWDGDVVLHETKSYQEKHASVDWEFDPRGFAPVGRLSDGNQQVCVTDIAGVPREVISRNGEVAWSASFTTFGRGESALASTIDCPIRFGGQWFDAETGLHYNRFRFYDPAAGRFISSDPVGLSGGLSLYAFPSNPFAYWDPYGLTADPCGTAVPVEGQHEYYYRAMSRADYETFLATGRMPGTTETFISPTLRFSQSYNGVLVKFQLAGGTTDALRAIGVRAHGRKSAALLPDLPTVRRGWGRRSALFKPEGSQVNIGLGTGPALNTFNNSIRGFEVLGVR
jgi:RHS repeat-associated protein